MEVVYVEWLDASGVHSIVSVNAAHRENLLLMQTAGVFISEDEQVLRLAQDYWRYDDDGSPVERCRFLSIIPKAAIQHRRQWDAAPTPVNAETVHINDPEGKGFTYRVGAVSPEGEYAH